ncbi:MAG: hypothetical protein IH913_08875 [Proteobacteria bacterium]|nr:hypothetical protein [Pseudomonadota bacterium]
MNEADIQVLATIRRTEVENESSDRATIESHTGKYWKYLEDWSDSWTRLVDAGFITGDDSGYKLTESGRPLAEKYYAERPDHFWYYTSTTTRRHKPAKRIRDCVNAFSARISRRTDRPTWIR